MSAEIRVPTLGESIVDATIATWLKHEGDTVHQGDALVELETDKVNVEVSAEQDGVLQKVIKQTGDVVAVDEVLGIIGTGAEAETSSGPASTSTAAPAEQTAASAVSEQQPVAQATPQTTQPAAASKPQPPVITSEKQSVPPARQASSEVQRPPSRLARRIAVENNIDINQIKGASPHGRIIKDDVIHYLEQNAQKVPTQSSSIPPAAPQPQPSLQRVRSVQEQQPGGNGAVSAPPVAPQAAVALRGPEERIPLSRRRQTIAQRLVEAQHSAAMLTTFNEIDMTAVMDVRSRRKDSFKERHNISLGFMSFFTKAVIGALKAFPPLNAEIQGHELVLKYYYDIGIAVGMEEGLVVPVLRDADRKSFAQIERDIADLARRAREGKLTLPELQGGTFTITNGGIYGSLLSTPILNAPQVGILGMHKIEQRPIALNGQVVIRPMMYVALSYDHRIVDGSEAVRFLVKVKELAEDPETLLLEG